jgi:uncharacterized phage protein (TIGR01671 family)
MNDRFKFRFWNKLRKAYENTYDLKCCEHLDYVVPEQCTGLKDKNGKLIYEGDLIKIDDDVAVINWSDYYARFMLESSEDIFDFERSYAEECEVIGNIHTENINDM